MHKISTRVTIYSKCIYKKVNVAGPTAQNNILEKQRMMKIAQTLGLLLLASVPLTVTSCKKQEEVPIVNAKDPLPKFDRFNDGDLPRVDYTNPEQKMPLINFDDEHTPGIHLFDKNKDEILDRNEILDYINVAFNNGDEKLSFLECWRLPGLGSRARYNMSDILPAEPHKMRDNIKKTDDNMAQLYKELMNRFTDEKGYVDYKPINLPEGNISRKTIESVLKEIIETEKIIAREEEMTEEVKRQYSWVSRRSLRQIVWNEAARKEVEPIVLRSKAIGFLLSNINPIWMEKLHGQHFKQQF